MKKNNDSVELYVVYATPFNHEPQPITGPMVKDDADIFADKLKSAMNDIESEFKWFDKISVKKYEPMDLYPTKQKKDPYDYSVLDDLDKQIAKSKEFKIKDDSKKVEKIKKVSTKLK